MFYSFLDYALLHCKVEMCFAELTSKKEGLEAKLILTMCAKRCPETRLVLLHYGYISISYVYITQVVSSNVMLCIYRNITA